MEPEIQEDAISPQEFVAFVTQAQNLAAELDDKELPGIAQQVISDYEMDKSSMGDWLDRMKRGLELAQLVKEDRSYPFKGAANVKYPLVTSAALQFNARAYPAIVPPDRIVNAKVWGADHEGKKAARAERVSEYESWQLSAQVEEWERDTDRLLVQLPIVGTMIRKWWFDPNLNRPRCRLVDPGCFVVNDKVKTLNDAPRLSEELPLYPNEIETRIRTGDFVSFEWTADDDEQGPQDFIEQHTLLDLDEDGLFEPYIVTVHKDTQTVVRIVADFREEDVSYKTETRPVQQMVPMQDSMGNLYQMPQIVPQPVATGINDIRRGSYFVAFEFMPGMDGSFHGTGLGLLLGDISDSINTIINMLLDAGHYASLGGGFLGSEIRLKGGSNRFQPGEWKTTTNKGQDLKNAIVPMTFPGPDATLYQMLGMLIEAGREISSVKDVVTGDGGSLGKNASPTTTLALIEQGMMVFTASYKRIFRSLKEEYRLLARINAETLDVETYSKFHDEMGEAQEGPDGQMMPGQPVQLDPQADFNLSDMDIQPVADPRNVTKMQQAAKAEMVMAWAQAGMADQGEALSRAAEAMDIEDVDALLPKPDPMQEQIAMLQFQGAQAEVAEKMAKVELTMAQVDEARSAAVENMANAQTDEARVRIEAQKLRFDQMMKLLEEDRARLETAVRGVEGMARASRDGGAQGSNGSDLGGAGAVPQGPMVFGG
jgi:chaperonin GroES